MIKNYPIKNSLLYKLSSKKELAELLGCSTNFISKFIPDRKNYHISEKPKASGGTRPIENPGRALKRMNRTLLQQLRTAEVPNYVKAGVPGRSTRDVAEMHRDNDYMVCMDIKSFYQRTSKKFIRSMFINTFEILPNLADFLARFITIPRDTTRPDRATHHLPTGAPISQLAAFCTYRKTFDDINNEANKLGIIFSLYVDDMTFSSKKPIPDAFISLIIKRLKSVGLSIKIDKTEYFYPSDTKTTVGLAITPKHEIKVSDKNRRKVVVAMNGKRLTEISAEEIRSLRGRLISAQQAEPNFMMTTKRRLDAEQKKKPVLTKKKRRSSLPKNKKPATKVRKLPVFEK